MEEHSTSIDPQSGMVKTVLRLFIAIGVMLLAAGLFFLIKSINTQSKYQKTTGEIVGFTSTGSVMNDTQTYKPVIRYGVNGRQYEFVSDVSSSTYRIGQKVPVRYDPASPQSATIGGVGAYLGPIILLPLGVIFIIVPAAVMRFIRPKE